ncbi:glycoside hydrolase family 19 protein [Pseudomonas protegens]|uniref:Glycoside hydrolase family 19 protein n=1 Tax=Pseudomonas protegens TaxID=380021 RepID=A0A7G8YN64_9PSED|nr:MULTISPECIES: glycoside hydrolase family 19 protein [Pseudomonas chlororaphis group]MCO7579133.1 glycoside hydrolase family 19 protein [Pseudomonas protegens]MCO7585136.1 glycoside hydrolase family 19 protein [Pseudomonas chlororaphis]MCO7602219.1 glycoside hydrolase family 19 protein [Pseudomonas chlororaphis]QNH77113.1 glycoside hydrolase family 19 protein [Pseudomonas protegens]QNL06308.1 glycoside hydrolase family 19 protein [Pseudomonas protegens]
MTITVQQLLQILPNAGAKAGVFVPALNAAMSKYAIITRLRMAAFIAQIGHESGQLQWVRELGSNQYLSKYDTGTLAKRLGNTPEADGDGQKYRGRGLIQVTGRANYEACSEALFSDARLLNTPELLEAPVYAALSAGWFWQRAGLNTLADKGDFLTITKRINGGTNGLADREALYQRALKVLP